MTFRVHHCRSLATDERGAIAIEYIVLVMVMAIGVGMAFVNSAFKVDAGNNLRGVGEGILGK